MVGDYHSHPYKSLSELRANKGWEYSDADLTSLPPFVEEVQVNHNRPVFSLVVAVAEGGKAGRGALRKKPNVIQVPVGDVFFVIGAYRINLDDTYDNEVDLSLPALV